MAKSKKRLTGAVLALCMALVLVPRLAFGVGVGYWYDGYWYEELAYWYSDYEGWYDGSSEEEEIVEAPEFVASYGEYNEQLFGIDVSEWNGPIDWEVVAEDGGIDFVVLKCGGSDDEDGCYTDGEFLHNAQECERLGIPYGVYFYSTAGTSLEAAREAYYVSDLISGLSPSLPVFIDLECWWLSDPECADDLTAVGSTFCHIIEDEGYEPGVYACESWWEYLLTDECFDAWAKWAAQYDGYCDFYGCQYWQFSSYGWIAGIDTPVDLNYRYI